jgi:hypothetical protein
VKHTYSLPGCKGPSGIAMDPTSRRIFIGCSDKYLMAIVNADSGKIVAKFPIPREDADASRFDPETRLAFASCVNGLSIIHMDSPDKFSVPVNSETQDAARTMDLDPETHQVFVVTADMGPAPPPTKQDLDPRRPIVPNTFAMLEFAPDIVGTPGDTNENIC